MKAGQVRPAVTTPLAVEYESVLNRPGMLPRVFGPDEITGFPDWFVSVSPRHRVHYLWRPRLPDPQNDLVLEAAMAASARYINHWIVTGDHSAPRERAAWRRGRPPETPKARR